jgi:hypothetical protein
MSCFRLLLACLNCVGPLTAQVETGRIIGSVRDQTGAVAPNAKVTLTNTQTNQSRDHGSRRRDLRVHPAAHWHVSSRGHQRRFQTRRSRRHRSPDPADYCRRLQSRGRSHHPGNRNHVRSPLLTVTEATQGQVIDNRKPIQHSRRSSVPPEAFASLWEYSQCEDFANESCAQ